MTEPTISIHIDMDVDLTPSEVWPDGVPETWTVDDVAAIIAGHGSARRFMSEWDLDDPDVDVTVIRPNPAYMGVDVLPGMTPPVPFTSDNRRVFPTWVARADAERRATEAAGS